MCWLQSMRFGMSGRYNDTESGKRKAADRALPRRMLLLRIMRYGVSEYRCNKAPPSAHESNKIYRYRPSERINFQKKDRTSRNKFGCAVLISFSFRKDRSDLLFLFPRRQEPPPLSDCRQHGRSYTLRILPKGTHMYIQQRRFPPQALQE